jgi:hypothetical protein
MSEFYVESNEENARELFEKRTIYQSKVSNSVDYPNLVNFNFGEKFLYGRVNRLFVPMILNTAILPLSKIRSTNNLSAINFVADAFNDLKIQFNKAVASGQIDTSDPFLGTLTVYKAWEDPEARYGTYLAKYFDSMVGALRATNTKIKNFDEFITEYKTLVKVSGYRLPFTKPAFIKGRVCPINCSGLAIEIADLDPTNDAEKMENFITSTNWEFYVNLCNSYGFMVDRFVPWRIVADIGSGTMVKYAAARGFKTTEMILNSGYKPAYRQYFQNFKYYFLNLYNAAKPTTFVEMEECEGRAISKIVTPQSYTVERFSELYSEEYFLKLYFETRFMEEESSFEDYEKEMLIDDCLEIYQAAGPRHALAIFEGILNKPFDYRGSLSYIIEEMAASAAEPT